MIFPEGCELIRLRKFVRLIPNLYTPLPVCSVESIPFYQVLISTIRKLILCLGGIITPELKQKAAQSKSGL
jgi:hypothetical protein